MIDNVHGVPFSRMDDARLQKEYIESMRHCYGIFGGNARRQMEAIGAELIRRGVTEIPNIFGPITICSK